jgi:hypothetical protein
MVFVATASLYGSNGFKLIFMFSSVFTLCSLASCNFELKSASPTLKFLRARLRGDAAPFGVKVCGLPCSTVLDDRLLRCVVVVYAAPASVFLYRSSPTERCVLPSVIRTSPCSMPSCERGGTGWPLLTNPPLSVACTGLRRPNGASCPV